MSKRKKLKQALMGAAALYGASKLMGMGAGASGKATVSDAQKTTQVPKIKKPTRAIDTGSKTMVGSKVKTTVKDECTKINYKIFNSNLSEKYSK